MAASDGRLDGSHDVGYHAFVCVLLVAPRTEASALVALIVVVVVAFIVVSVSVIIVVLSDNNKSGIVVLGSGLTRECGGDLLNRLDVQRTVFA